MRKIVLLVGVLALVALSYYGATYNSIRGQDEFIKVEVTPEPPKELPPEIQEQQAKFIKEQTEAMVKGSTLINISGPETTGSVIMVAGKELQLPKDVMVEAFVATGLCIDGIPCPELPQFVLLYTDGSGDKIGVSANSGAIDNFYRCQETGVHIQERFTWLYDALGVQKPAVEMECQK